MVHQNNCLYHGAVLWHGHFPCPFTDDSSRQMLPGQVKDLSRWVLDRRVTEKATADETNCGASNKIWHNTFIYLLAHIYKRNGKSSAVTNIIFQMTAQWVPKATNMLPLILFSIDALLSVAVAHLLQNMLSFRKTYSWHLKAWSGSCKTVLLQMGKLRWPDTWVCGILYHSL